MPRPAVDSSNKNRSFLWKQENQPAPPETPKKLKKKRSLQCDEILDQQELEATQPVDVPFSDDESGDEASGSADPEDEFRETVAEAIREHGLESVRSWFAVECRRFKKPKLEKNK